MHILSVQLKNIKSHRQSAFDFSPGINVLSGPNGVGKSTLFEAIGYALFGVEARDFVTKIERFLTIGAARGEVAVTFAPGDGLTWRATRTVGGGAKWLLAKKIGEVFEVEEHAGAAETEARIARLLGLDNGRPLADQFKLVIGPFQNDFLGPFVIRQPTRRQTAFDEILGIDSWRKTFEGTGDLQKEIAGRIQTLEAEVAGKRDQIALLPERRTELADTAGQEAGRRGDLKEAETTLAQVTEGLRDLDALERTIHESTARLKGLEERILAGREHVATQKALVGEARLAEGLVAENRPGKEAFDRAEQTLKQLREREKSRQASERNLLALDKAHDAGRQKIALEQGEIDKTARQLEEDLRNLEQTVRALEAPGEVRALASSLPELRQENDRLKTDRSQLQGSRAGLLEGREKLAEGLCPYFAEPCRNLGGKPPRDVFTDRLEGLDGRIGHLEAAIAKQDSRLEAAEGAEKELASRRVQVQELTKQKTVLQQRQARNLERGAALERLRPEQERLAEDLAAARREREGYRGIEEAIASAEAECERHRAARDAFQAHLQAAGEMEGRQQTLDRYGKALEGLQKEQAAGAAGLRDLQGRYRSGEHAAARTEKDRLVARAAALDQELKGLARNRERLEEEVGRLQAVEVELKARKEQIKVLRKQEELVRFLRNRVFKQVSARLSERFREEIGRRADRIYRSISEADEELHWGENYQVCLRDLSDGDVRTRSDDQLSGGQMMSAVVALRLALLQSLGARMAFFDEPTSNLDAGRRENLAQAFRAIDQGQQEVSEHWYDQLFLISHDVSFTEITDQVIDLGE
ncbi:SMC family ATPase [uncultured Desulfuromonas sp.]|uniref:AAA family ATPase n=1 Tax=uncultured Desulfuromonas sp. TaxID=181013 RepID=UPI00260CCB2F|nr:SMC family ATPase [uncultured Desulfuromonas sp.]